MDGSNVNLYIVLFMIILMESNDETTNISVQVHDPLSTTLPPKRELPMPCGQTAFVGMRCGRSDRKEADEGGAEDAGRRGYPRFTGYYFIILLLLLTHLGRVVPQISKAVSSIYAVGPAQSTRVWQHQSDEEGVIPARDVLSIAH